MLDHVQVESIPSERGILEISEGMKSRQEIRVKPCLAWVQYCERIGDAAVEDLDGYSKSTAGNSAEGLAKVDGIFTHNDGIEITTVVDEEGREGRKGRKGREGREGREVREVRKK